MHFPGETPKMQQTDPMRRLLWIRQRHRRTDSIALRLHASDAQSEKMSNIVILFQTVPREKKPKSAVSFQYRNRPRIAFIH
jgi:hypothetical protein